MSRNEGKDATSKAPVQAQVTLEVSHTAGIHNHRKVRHEGKNTARPQRTLLVCANLGNISNRRQFFFIFLFLVFFLIIIIILDTQSKYLCTTWLHKINYDFSTSQTIMHSLLRQLKDTTVSCGHRVQRGAAQGRARQHLAGICAPGAGRSHARRGAADGFWFCCINGAVVLHRNAILGRDLV